jgi:hypothetical protein
MTTDVGVAPETQLSASLSEGPLMRSNALDPPRAAILAAGAVPAWTYAFVFGPEHLSAGTCTDGGH